MSGEPFRDLPERVWFLCYCETIGAVHTVELWKCGPWSRVEVPTAVKAVFRKRPDTDLCYVCDREPDVAAAEKAVLAGSGIAKLPGVLVLCVNEAKQAARERGEKN